MAKFFKPNRVPKFYSNPNQEATPEDHTVRKAVSTREGTVEKVPVDPSDIANKAYVDAIAGGPIATVSDTTTIDLNIDPAKDLTASVKPAGIAHNDLGSIGANDHHNAATCADSNTLHLNYNVQHLTGSVSYQDTATVDLGEDAGGLKADVIPGGIDHDNLNNVGTDNHHARDHAATHANGAADPVDHNTLTNYSANQHIDWTVSQAPTVIHADNYTDTTYTAGTGLQLAAGQFSTKDSEINHDNLLNFVAAEHYDWTNETHNLLTTGTGTFGGTVTIKGGGGNGTIYGGVNAGDDLRLIANSNDALPEIRLYGGANGATIIRGGSGASFIIELDGSNYLTVDEDAVTTNSDVLYFGDSSDHKFANETSTSEAEKFVHRIKVSDGYVKIQQILGDNKQESFAGGFMDTTNQIFHADTHWEYDNISSSNSIRAYARDCMLVTAAVYGAEIEMYESAYNYGHWYPDYNPVLHATIYNSSLSGCQSRFGFYNVSRTQYAYVYQSGSGNWYFETHDGVASENTNTGLACSTYRPARMTIVFDGTTSVKLYINETLAATHTTRVPSDWLQIYARVRTTTGSARNIRIRTLYATQDVPTNNV